MSKLLVTEEFENSCEFADIINVLTYVADAQEPNEDEFPLIYITDGAGNQFNKALLYEDTLTDGSKVYRIELVTK